MTMCLYSCVMAFYQRILTRRSRVDSCLVHFSPARLFQLRYEAVGLFHCLFTDLVIRGLEIRHELTWNTHRKRAQFTMKLKHHLRESNHFDTYGSCANRI